MEDYQDKSDVCTNCGMLMRSEDKFCSNCGSGRAVFRIPEQDDLGGATTAAQKEKWCCQYCGAEICSGASFCTSCGVPTAQEQTTATEAVSAEKTAEKKGPGRKRPALRWAVLLFCLIGVLLIVLLSTNASRGNSGVPEQLVRDDIEDKFGSADISYSISHDMDKSTKIDTVTIKVTRTKKYCKEHIVGVCKYRYNKSDDVWDSYGKKQWETERIEYIESAFETKWEGNFKRGGSYSVKITSVDFESGTAAGTFTASYTTLSLGGSQREYKLNVTGRYSIQEDSDGYLLEITESRCTYVFLFHPYYGFYGVNARAN